MAQFTDFSKSLIIFRYCNATHDIRVGLLGAIIKQYLPRLFQDQLLCAGYTSTTQNGPCSGDSGGPLAKFNTLTEQTVQIAILNGGVSACGDQDIPAIYTRVDYPEILDFILQSMGFSTEGKTLRTIFKAEAEVLCRCCNPVLMRG